MGTFFFGVFLNYRVSEVYPEIEIKINNIF